MQGFHWDTDNVPFPNFGGGYMNLALHLFNKLHVYISFISLNLYFKFKIIPMGIIILT